MDIWTKGAGFFGKIVDKNQGGKMAYDLEELKRVVEDTEKFLAQPNTTLTEIQERVANLTEVIQNYAQVHNSVVENNKDVFNTLVTKVGEVVNDLDNRVNSINESVANLANLSEEEIETLNEQIATLKNITENLDVAILETIDIVADEVNAMKRTAFFHILVDSTDGIKQIDVSAFGFEDTNYAVIATAENDWMVQPIIKDKTANSLKVALVDRRHFANHEVYKDCSENAVSVNIIIAYNPKTVISKVVNTQNSSVTVGN